MGHCKSRRYPSSDYIKSTCTSYYPYRYLSTSSGANGSYQCSMGAKQALQCACCRQFRSGYSSKGSLSETLIWIPLARKLVITKRTCIYAFGLFYCFSGVLPEIPDLSIMKMAVWACLMQKKKRNVIHERTIRIRNMIISNPYSTRALACIGEICLYWDFPMLGIASKPTINLFQGTLTPQSFDTPNESIPTLPTLPTYRLLFCL